MSRSSQVGKTLLVEACAFLWVLALAALIVLRHQGVLSVTAVRFFSTLLVGVALIGPFALIGFFLYKRSRLDRDVIVNGVCPGCGYDLRGQPGWGDASPGSAIRCPECGAMGRRAVGRDVHPPTT